MKSVLTGLGTMLLAATLLSGCERPPVEAVQAGYRGTGMAQMNNPRLNAARDAAQALPAPVPAAADGGPLAKETFKNVPLLGELSVGEFTRTMLAITAWVSPKEGCAYCHAALPGSRPRKAAPIATPPAKTCRPTSSTPRWSRARCSR
jgi:photosynthetic reaction center cytochrome c subunit